MHVLTPSSVDEAVALLADGAATPMAGGTDLMVEWPLHPERHGATYLDLSGVEELRGHRWEDGALVLGGMTTYWDVVRDARARAEFPVLVEAARQVGAIQIQSRGTWAGNIVNASPAADGVPALMAHDATIELRSARGTERVPLEDFYLGYKQMRRSPDQLLTSIRVPRRPHDIQIFEKVGARRAQAITKVGLAIVRSSTHGWRVVANSMAPTVCRCRTVEGVLGDRQPIARPEDFLPAIDADVQPIDDIRSTASYRRSVMSRLLYHGLRPHCEWIG